MHASDSKVSKRYWAGLACTLALASPVVLLNVIVNPLGLFGAPRQHAFNRVTPIGVLRTIGWLRQTRFYDAIVTDPRTDRFLIGDSRVGQGMSTCGLPIERIVGFSWELRDFDPVVRRLLTSRRRPATVFLQLPVMTADRPQRPPPAWLARLYAAASPDGLKLSLTTLRANLGETADRTARPPNCQLPDALDIAPPPPASFERQKQLYVRFERKRYVDNLAALAGIVKAADATCARQHLRHHLILFRLPTSAAPTDEMRDLDIRAEKDAHHAIAASRGKGAICAITLADFSTQPPGGASGRAMWHDPRHWIDGDHFDTTLGATSLSALSALAGR